jgi:hypothetical protein
VVAKLASGTLWLDADATRGMLEQARLRDID